MNTKRVLITGGSSGIGLSLARKYISTGDHVFILARTDEKLKASLDELVTLRSTNEQQCDIIQADVSDYASLEKHINIFIHNHGVPDILINSAGVCHPGEFMKLDMDIFHWMMDINYFGTINMIKLILPHMLIRKQGHIVNISSIAGFIGIYGYTAYSSSKYAIRGFSDCLRCEIKPLGVNMSVVFPPDTQTPQLEYDNLHKPEITKSLSGSAGIMSADDVAQCIYKGIQQKKYLIIPGTEGKILYFVNNMLGRTIYPLIDFLVSRASKSDKKPL